MGYPKYDSYKETGIDWIGDIPSHWKQVKFKYIGNLMNGYAFNSNDYIDKEGIPIIRIGDIKKEIEWDKVKRVPSEYKEKLDNDFLVKNEDILLALTGATIGKSSIFNYEKTALLNQRVGVIRSNKSNSKFVYYYLNSNTFNKFINFTSYGGAQENIGKEDINNLWIILPPLKEQKNIKNFLNKETSRIDKLIEKKEKLIELLEEKRKAVITHYVTKGLDPDAPMKDSGIEWLGEIPEHWDVMRLKYNIKLNPSKKEANINNDDRVTFLPMENIHEDGTINNEGKLFKEIDNRFTYFRENDVLLAKITPCFENGKSTLAKDLYNSVGFGTTEIHVLRARENIYNKFLYYIIRSHPFLKIGEAQMTGSAGQKRISKSFINNYSQGIPPIEEQKEIVKYLEEILYRIKKLRSKIEKQISNLKEYRQALITNAVTGKIDVRNLV